MKQEDIFGETPLEEADDGAKDFEIADLTPNAASQVSGGLVEAISRNQRVIFCISATEFYYVVFFYDFFHFDLPILLCFLGPYFPLTSKTGRSLRSFQFKDFIYCYLLSSTEGLSKTLQARRRSGTFAHPR